MAKTKAAPITPVRLSDTQKEVFGLIQKEFKLASMSDAIRLSGLMVRQMIVTDPALARKFARFVHPQIEDTKQAEPEEEPSGKTDRPLAG